MSRPRFLCPECDESLGTIRPAKDGADYLDVTNALVIVWWDGEREAHGINCPCGEIVYWRGVVNWRPIAA